jgi:hypothetical protein
MEDTWTKRDLPVLAALVEVFDDPAFEQIRAPRVAELTGIDEATVDRALTALSEARLAYLETVDAHEERAPAIVTGVTERARRAVGAWPTPESLADQLALAFATAAEEEQDPERKSRLKEMAGWLGGTARAVFVEVAATVLSKHVGM